jgi:hypothetical protein
LFRALFGLDHALPVAAMAICVGLRFDGASLVGRLGLYLNYATPPGIWKLCSIENTIYSSNFSKSTVLMVVFLLNNRPSGQGIWLAAQSSGREQIPTSHRSGF